MSLSGFKSVEWPDVFPVKLVYNDERAVVASGNQGEYIYRLNSVFDPDETGVGGQPAGFDQLKTLYGRYRVMAVEARVSLACMTSGAAAFLAVAPVDNAALGSIAEDVACLRHAMSAEAANGSKLAVIKKLWHIGELLGYSDESMLANSNMDGAVTGNPAFQQHMLVCFETTGATDTCELEIQLTYYVRMELPTAVEDAVASHKVRAMRSRASAALQAAAAAALPSPDLSSPTIPSESAVTYTAQPPRLQSTSVPRRPGPK
jgi:hypothetical protein